MEKQWKDLDVGEIEPDDEYWDKLIERYQEERLYWIEQKYMRY